jgi:hypothetical protein
MTKYDILFLVALVKAVCLSVSIASLILSVMLFIGGAPEKEIAILLIVMSLSQGGIVIYAHIKTRKYCE